MWWTKAAFDGEVPQPLYGVGVSGIDRGTSPAATPVNDSGVVFFVGISWSKNEVFVESHL